VFLWVRPDVRIALVDAAEVVRFALAGPDESRADLAPIPMLSLDSPSVGHSLNDHSITVATFAQLPNDQRAAADYLVRKYRVAPDAVAALVGEAYRTGAEHKVDPLLILAVMSIESAMNPIAQSQVGAQGLMQVMTPVHADRFVDYGGTTVALNPIVNIRVGTEILRELIVRFGSVEAGLKAYVGSATQNDDGGYGARVLGERARLELSVGRIANRRSADEATASQGSLRAVGLKQDPARATGTHDLGGESGLPHRADDAAVVAPSSPVALASGA
jgi:soluble lytic murein transglycosylase-like protein